MDNSDIRELMGRLEALEALAKLFNNLWFERIRDDIHDTKVQAYLTVFDDAFPHLNHVIEFVRRSAGLLSEEEVSPEQWQRLQGEFDCLHRLLRGGGEALDSRPRGLTGSPSTTAPSPATTDRTEDEDIDALFARDDEASEVPSIAGEMIDEREEIDDSDALAAAARIEAEETGGAEELEELLEGVEEEDMADEDVELEELLAAEGEEEIEGTGEAETAVLLEDDQEGADDDAEDADLMPDELFEEEDDESDAETGELDDLLADDNDNGDDGDDEVAAGISEDEMSALLDEDEDDSDKGGNGATKDDGKAADEEDDDGASISQDEIDALFG